jgi:M6 family metalloprotease-like protein
VGVNKFFDAMSDGAVKFEWRFENKYHRMPRALKDYSLTRTGGGNFNRFVQDAINAADPTVNFSEVDFVVAVMPPNVTRELADVSPALILSASSPFATSEGKVFRGTLAAADTRFNEGYLLIVHEFGHLLGLQDYYFYGWNQSMPLPEQFKFMGQFDNMNYAPGDSREWTAWNRWILSFLPDSKVRCLAKTAPADSTHLLTAGSTGLTNSQMVVITTSETSAIVVESRRNLRYDARATAISNGLLVYRVNTQKTSGYGPIEVIRKPTTRDPYLADAPLRKGETLVVDGVTITNLDSGDLWDLAKVTITR